MPATSGRSGPSSVWAPTTKAPAASTSPPPTAPSATPPTSPSWRRTRPPRNPTSSPASANPHRGPDSANRCPGRPTLPPPRNLPPRTPNPTAELAAATPPQQPGSKSTPALVCTALGPVARGRAERRGDEDRPRQARGGDRRHTPNIHPPAIRSLSPPVVPF